MRERWRKTVLALVLGLVVCVAATSGVGEVRADTGSRPLYSSLDELAGKTFAYLNGSVYDLKVREVVPDAKEVYYPSFSDCVAAVKAGKADAAVQLSLGCELAVNRSNGDIALLPESMADVEESFFFPHGSALKAEVDSVIQTFYDKGLIDELVAKWTSGDDSKKTVPTQDWDAPKGTLRFATPGALEPYSYVGGGDQALGYDVDLALNIARELGYHLDIQVIPVDSIVASVQTGKVDFGGSLTATPERAQMVDFSTKIMPDHISVIVKADKAQAAGRVPEYSTIKELEGKTVAVLNGSVYDDVLTEATGLSFNFEYYNLMTDCIQAVKGGKADTMMADEPFAMLMVAENPDLAIMDETPAKDDYGIIFSLGNPLRDEFDKVIEQFRADGTLAALEEKWFGADEAAKVISVEDADPAKGTLICSTTGSQVPMTYMGDDGLVGYDIELVKLIAKELGYTVEFNAGDFASVLASVSTGKADLGACCISISDERKKSFDFTEPYYYGSVAMVVRNRAEATSDDTVISRLISAFKRTFVEEDRWQLVVSGLVNTIVISVLAGILGILLGYVTVLQRRRGKVWPGRIVDGYQALMGGIPLVVVLMVLYYVVFGSIDINGLIVAIIAFTLSFGSTAGSTMWTAVSSLNSIQEETGLALGFTRKQVFHEILFPQAASVFMPQLAGQFVSMVKETAIVGYIAVLDLTRASDLIRARTMDAFFPLVATALIYFLFCRVLARALNALVAKLDKSKRPKTVKGVEL